MDFRHRLASRIAFEEIAKATEEIRQLITHGQEGGSRIDLTHDRRIWRRRDTIMAALAQPAFSSSDGQAFLMQEPANQRRKLYVTSSVDPVSAARLERPQRGKLALPVTQDMRAYADDLRHFPNLEEQFVWQVAARHG
jgi:hypothetical protein